MDFSKSNWISETIPDVTFKRTVDGNEFVITGNGTTATINGFPITEAEYSKVLEGEKITVTAGGKIVTVENKDKTVIFDGKAFSQGGYVTIETNTVGSLMKSFENPEKKNTYLNTGSTKLILG